MRYAFALLALLLPGSATAQPLTPVWTKPDQFWFYRPAPGGTGLVWLNVDAQHGVKEPLFDHQRLAIELNLRMGTNYEPLTLPFADTALHFVVKYDGSNAYIQEGAMAVEFIVGGQLWRCDLQTKWNWNKVPPTDYECLVRRPVTSADLARRVTAASAKSPDGRHEAFIENHNVAIRNTQDGSTRALTNDGTAGDAWHAGSLHWDGDTLRAWKLHENIWESESITGNVKPQLTRGEWRVSGR